MNLHRGLTILQRARTLRGMTLATFGLFFGPRIALAAMWVLTDRIDDAFDRAVWPALGLALSPTATILYVLLWTQDAGGGGVTGAEWVIVGLAAAVDLAIWVTRLVPERSVGSIGR